MRGSWAGRNEPHGQDTASSSAPTTTFPSGATRTAAEQLYQESLKPFLAVLYRYPGFPVTLHYSGILMEWLEEFTSRSS